MLGRREPYTEQGIKRVPCARCGKPSVHQFEICALNRRHVAICGGCDVELNRTVLEFIGADNVAELMAAYEKLTINEPIPDPATDRTAAN